MAGLPTTKTEWRQDAVFAIIGASGMDTLLKIIGRGEDEFVRVMKTQMGGHGFTNFDRRAIYRMLLQQVKTMPMPAEYKKLAQMVRDNAKVAEETVLVPEPPQVM